MNHSDAGRKSLFLVAGWSSSDQQLPPLGSIQSIDFDSFSVILCAQLLIPRGAVMARKKHSGGEDFFLVRLQEISRRHLSIVTLHRAA